MCDFRTALRNATAPQHDEIDNLFGAFDLSNGDGLARFLMAQAIGMQACQPRAMRFGQRSLGCSPPDYVQALAADLAMLDIDAARLPRLALPGVITDGTGDAGVFYVVAGSRMGAAVLRTRATAPTPQGPASRACSFFAAGEGAATWRVFRKWLASESTNVKTGVAAGLPAIIDAAKATFQLFGEAARWAAQQPVGDTNPTGFAA